MDNKKKKKKSLPVHLVYSKAALKLQSFRMVLLLSLTWKSGIIEHRLHGGCHGTEDLKDIAIEKV